jgi:hypothetical protein
MPRAWITVPGEDIIPACPDCKSAEHVRKGELRKSKYYPPARSYICGQCEKRFLRESDRASTHPEIDPRSSHPDAPQQKLEPEPGDAPVRPPDDITQPITSGTWRIKARLAQSLSAMFQHAHGFRPDEVTLNAFVSELLANEVASFRLTHSDFIFRSQSRPPRRILDPCKIVKEVSEE